MLVPPAFTLATASAGTSPHISSRVLRLAGYFLRSGVTWSQEAAPPGFAVVLDSFCGTHCTSVRLRRAANLDIYRAPY